MSLRLTLIALLASAATGAGAVPAPAPAQDVVSSDVCRKLALEMVEVIKANPPRLAQSASGRASGVAMRAAATVAPRVAGGVAGGLAAEVLNGLQAETQARAEEALMTETDKIHRRLDVIEGKMSAAGCAP